MKYREPISLNDIINIVKKREDRDKSYCIYSSIFDIQEVNLETVCYIDEYPEIDEENEDEEIYPDFVNEMSLELLMRDELIQDVVFNVINQKVGVSNEQILDAIIYYCETDDFLDL